MSELLFTADQHAHAAALSTRFAAEYLGSVSERPVFPLIDRDALRAILNETLPEEGRPIEMLFAELDEVIVPNSTHTAHPRFLPYVQPSPNGLSPFADAVAATLNQNCNLWQLSPAANAIEQVTVRWLAELSGFGAPTGGLLTSGGSVANLVGLAAARDWALGDGAREHGLQHGGAPLVLYASDQTHSSVDKAARILGLGAANVRQIPSDGAFMLRADALARAVADDRARGLAPFAVVASAGSVTTGAFDPLDEIADFCEREALWLHVDGAYGALAGMSGKFAPALAGIARANSLSLDPHKFLFTSFDAGCVLVRDPQALRRSFAVTSSYLAQPADTDFIDYADHGPQLSRAFRATQGVVVAASLRPPSLRRNRRTHGVFGRVHGRDRTRSSRVRAARARDIQLRMLPPGRIRRRRQPQRASTARSKRPRVPRSRVGQGTVRAARPAS